MGWSGRCGSSSVVEHQPSKLRVAGSKPVSRSNSSRIISARFYCSAIGGLGKM